MHSRIRMKDTFRRVQEQWDLYGRIRWMIGEGHFGSWERIGFGCREDVGLEKDFRILWEYRMRGIG